MAEGGTVTGELVERDTSGFWIVGAMSPFVLGGIGGLARERVKAERAGTSPATTTTLRQVIVKQWGFPYSPRGRRQRRGQGSGRALRDDLELGKVAHGVRFLTFWRSTPGWGFDWLVRGWGVGGESWIVDYGRIAQHPAPASRSTRRPRRGLGPPAGPVRADLSAGRRLRPGHEDPRLATTARAQPGVTTQAYEAWRAGARPARPGCSARSAAARSGRSSRPRARRPRGAAPGVTYPDTGRKSNRAAGRGEVPQAQFNPNLFKDDLAGQLKTAMPGPWLRPLPGRR
jgi:hypothetical protein